VRSASLDAYVAAFLARCDATRRPGQAKIDEPGVHGLLPTSDDPHARLLVTDDRAHDVLSALLIDARAGIINVCAAAGHCASLLATQVAWRRGMAMAMVCRDLHTVPTVRLRSQLTLRPVRRLAGDAPAGVSLTEAVAAATRADPAITDPEGLAHHLLALPRAFRLLAAVDGDDVVRATAGSGTFGTTASVIFVNTDPDWRRRGIGQAMTDRHGAADRQAGRGTPSRPRRERERPVHLPEARIRAHSNHALSPRRLTALRAAVTTPARMGTLGSPIERGLRAHTRGPRARSTAHLPPVAWQGTRRSLVTVPLL
jgi:hypothetical protein